VWVCATNIGFILALLGLEISIDDRLNKNASNTPNILVNFNRNQLAVFMMGNVMTGLINFSINTLESSSTISFAVLNLYAFTLSMIAQMV